MKEISSLANPVIKHVCSLHDRAQREKHHQFIAEGIRTVSTLCGYDMKLVWVFVTFEMIEKVPSAVDDSQICIVTNQIMQKISTVVTPSGIVAVFEIPQHEQQPTEPQTPGLVLAQISDPGNMGTLIRTAAAVGVKCVVVTPGSVDPWSSKVVHASAGTIGAVKMHQWDWKTLVDKCGQLPLVALVVSGGEKPNPQIMHKGLLVVGSEATGIPDEWLKDCSHKVTIPMPGNTESLNAAVAGSIALYLACVKVD